MALVNVHSWVWAVLPPLCRHVCVVGDPDLAEVLRCSGIEVDENADTADVLLVAGGSTGADPVHWLSTSRAQLVVLALPTWPARASRLLRHLLTPVSLAVTHRALRVAGRTARSSARTVQVLRTGDRSFRYLLGAGRWPGVRRTAVSAVLVAADGQAPTPTTLHVVQAAESALGCGPLHVGAAMVTESGKILQALRTARGEHLLQILGGGPSRPLVERSLETLELLRASNPPATVSDHVPWPLWSGRIGLVTTSVEPWLPGHATRHLTPQLWDDCLSFLLALWGTGTHEPTPAGTVEARLQGSVSALADVAGDGAHAHLQQLLARLLHELETVSLGWAHGDLWSRNLLVVDGRLGTVVDWDSASRWALPCGDLFDLISNGSRALRHPGPGPRTFQVLWPGLASCEPLRDYCRAIGLTADERLLQALAIAYWLDRTSRDLEPFRWNSRQPGWVEHNVRRPLAFLAEDGWTAARPVGLHEGRGGRR